MTVACRQIKDFRWALLLGAFLLSQSSGSSSSCSGCVTAGAPMAQKVTLTAGTPFTYKVDLGKVSDGASAFTATGSNLAVSHQRLSASSTTIDMSLLDPNGIVVKSVGNAADSLTATLSYTPSSSGTYIIRIAFNVTLTAASIEPEITGGTAEGSVGAAEVILAPANPSRVINGFVGNSFVVIIYGTISGGTFAPITGATVEIKVGGNTCALTLQDPATNWPTFAFAGQIYTHSTWSSTGCGNTNYASTQTAQLIITDAVNGNFTSNAIQIPNNISAVKIDGVSLTGSASFTVSKSSSHTITYTMPATVPPVALYYLAGKQNGGKVGTNLNIGVANVAAAGATDTFTIPAGMGSVMTTANDVDAYGILSASNPAVLLDFANGGTFTGVDGSTGNLLFSAFQPFAAGNVYLNASESNSRGYSADNLTVTD
ncbi:MAG: hypothetical protein HS115_15535 [Spirochaetales bacterium]|nr:hypothetical protein [Spirochaetales bacterium]